MSDIKQISIHDFGAALQQRQAQFRVSAESDKEGKFPKGEPADPTVNMTDEQKAEWERQNEANRDKFKSAGVAQEVLHLSTRGGRYEIKVFYDFDSDLYSAKSFTQGRQSGAANNHKHRQMVKWVEDAVQGARDIDGINYKVVSHDRDAFAIRLASDESDTDAMYADGEKLTGKALADWKKKHPELAENAEDPPPEAKALKDKMKSKSAAGGPDPRGRNWKDKGGRWVWAGSDGDPAFTVVEKSAPFGSYYKLQILLPDGNMYAAANQKTEKEDLFKRAAQLYKAWGSAAGFDLSRQPERWSKMASADAAEADRAQARADEAEAEAKREEAEAEELKKSAGVHRDRLTWNPEVRAKMAAKGPGGLYGFTKKVQADCEACTRKLSRKAASLARAAWQKDERVAAFLSTHAKRSKSSSAKLLIAAMKDIGPKVASTMEKHAAEDKAAAYGMYGHPAKVARLGLTACASLKEAAGELAADLHRRRADKHATYTGFLTAHSKQARDGYARMLLSYYPDGDTKIASLQPPASVDDWLSWED